MLKLVDINSEQREKVLGLEVMEEAAELLRGIRFKTDERIDREGDLVMISVVPRRDDDTKTFHVLITCYARAHQVVDWKQCQVMLWSESEKGNIITRPLNQRGQVIIEDLAHGDYQVTLDLPVCEEKPLIPIGRVIAAAAAVIILGAIIWSGPKAVAEDIHNVIAKTTAILKGIIMRNEANKAAWAELKFEEVVKPMLRVLPAEPEGKLNFVRVELSPRVEEGLVRDVSVCWGDAGDTWEPIYEAEGIVKNFQAIHKYETPLKGQTTTWFLRVLYTVTDAVAAARRLTPEQLTSTCKVEVSADGIFLEPGIDTSGLAPLVAAGAQPEITWLDPVSGSEVGWKTDVKLKSTSATEKVTILVRPHPGATFYVQSGGHPLSANKTESFDVQLGSGRQQEIGKDFDILAVCSNNFRPNLPILDMSDVPHSFVVARITVTKTAGVIRMEAEQTIEERKVGVEGEIWTSNGGALLLKEGQEFRVLDTLLPSPVGTKYTKVLSVPASDGSAIYLLVYKENAPVLQIGQKISVITTDSYWLYGPAKK
jgi:hypothetical protein